MPELDLRLQVGKYDVQKLLGKGSTGTVYLAKDTFTGREVALKTLEPEVFRDERFGSMHRAQFLNEASLAGKLRHPHIVAILDAVVGEESATSPWSSSWAGTSRSIRSPIRSCR